MNIMKIGTKKMNIKYDLLEIFSATERDFKAQRESKRNN